MPPSKPPTPEDEVKLIQQLPQLYTQLETLHESLSILSSNPKKIEKISVPFDIYFSSPSVFASAISELSPSEISQLQALSSIPLLPISHPLSSSFNSILTNPTISLSLTPEQIKTSLEELSNSNITLLEQTQKAYDDLTLAIKAIETINPLDLIPFPDEYKFKRLFSLNADSMLKFIRSFIVKSLKETSRPNTPSRKGSINFRRTIRASMQYEGEPYMLHRRSKSIKIRQNKPIIYFLLDTSGSQSEGIYASVAIAYAVASVLKDIDVVIYTASEVPCHPLTFKLIQEAERKNITETRIDSHLKTPRDLTTTQRFNKASILKFANHPLQLYDAIESVRSSSADNTAHMIKSLSASSPENSIFIALGDNDQFNNSVTDEMNKQIPSKDIAAMKSKLKGRVFYFNTNSFWPDSYQKLPQSHAKWNFKPFKPSNFNSNDIIFFPTQSYRSLHPNMTYGDWVRAIIEIISGKPLPK
jgi:hypothetical protein